MLSADFNQEIWCSLRWLQKVLVKVQNTVCKENNIVTTFGDKVLCSVMGAELGARTDYL